jgi:hypothetical protein
VESQCSFHLHCLDGQGCWLFLHIYWPFVCQEIAKFISPYSVCWFLERLVF